MIMMVIIMMINKMATILYKIKVDVVIVDSFDWCCDENDDGDMILNVMMTDDDDNDDGFNW